MHVRPKGRSPVEAGFSLVELMIVICVIAIITGLWVGNAISAQEEARATTCEKNRSLYEDAEQLFFHREGRQSESLDELVDHKYLNKVTCPRGGELAWEDTDPDQEFTHFALICSLHGPKSRIQGWEHGGDGEAEASGPTLLGAGFEGGTFGAWTTLGAASIKGSSFGSPYAGDSFSYVDTNTSSWKVVPKGKLATFLGVTSADLQSLGNRNFTGGSAMKVEADNATLEEIRFNFLTQEYTPIYWYNDTAFMTVSNETTGKQEVYKLADTYSDFSSSKTKFKDETGWLSLEDVGVDVELEEGDVVGFGVMNMSDTVVSSAIFIDEGGE